MRRGADGGGDAPRANMFCHLARDARAVIYCGRHTFRNNQLCTGPLRCLTTSAFIERNGGAALFRHQPSPDHHPTERGIRSKAPRPRQQSLLPSRGSRKRLRDCQIPISWQSFDSKSSNRSCTTPKYKRHTPPPGSGWRGNGNGLVFAIGEPLCLAPIARIGCCAPIGPYARRFGVGSDESQIARRAPRRVDMATQITTAVTRPRHGKASATLLLSALSGFCRLLDASESQCRSCRVEPAARYCIALSQ